MQKWIYLHRQGILIKKCLFLEQKNLNQFLLERQRCCFFFDSLKEITMLAINNSIAVKVHLCMLKGKAKNFHMHCASWCGCCNANQWLLAAGQIYDHLRYGQGQIVLA